MKSFCRLVLVYFVLISFCSKASHAEDWSQWNGPTRDEKFSFEGIITFRDSPELVWKQSVRLGFSDTVVASDRVILLDYLYETGGITNNEGKRVVLKGKELFSCFGRVKGLKLWQHSNERPCKVSYLSWPRATPVIHNRNVYSLGSESNLLCIELTSGDIKWPTSFNTHVGAKTPLSGYSASPLVLGIDLIGTIGGTGFLVGVFDLKTGNVKWKWLSSQENETRYCPPRIASAGGTQQFMIWSQTTLYRLNPFDDLI